ncbi:holliday junction DNA helicase [Halorubrum phage Hardycor1]|nr:holliday junction DNA helicase [Halorubrum phage Hardycor1]
MGGARYERELVNALDRHGYVAMRAPSSGSATTRDLPDVLALRSVTTASGRVRSEVLAVEVKSTSATTAYAEQAEGEALERFADEAGATAYVSARFKRQGSDKRHYLVPLDACRMTDAGSYGVPESDAEERAALVVNVSTDEVRRP